MCTVRGTRGGTECALSVGLGVGQSVCSQRDWAWDTMCAERETMGGTECAVHGSRGSILCVLAEGLGVGHGVLAEGLGARTQCEIHGSGLRDQGPSTPACPVLCNHSLDSSFSTRCR